VVGNYYFNQTKIMADNNNNNNNTDKRGFASMDPDKQREIARKGGETVSQDREHMREIGRKGGEARSDDQDMKSGETGRKGGMASRGDEGGGMGGGDEMEDEDM